MALDLGDVRNGFRHTEVVKFINEEVLNNGGGPDFYLTFRSRPWNEIEDELRSIIADPHVPQATKRACTWSALALNVRVVARQVEQQAYGVSRLQEQMGEREMAAWALASQLQRLRKERDLLVSQLRGVREDLRQALNDCESVRRWQLVQAERWSQEVVTESRPQLLGYDVWPMNADERNKVLVEMRQRRKDVDSQRQKAQMASTTGVLYVPGSTSPWAQVVEAPLPMPFSMEIPYPPPPAPTVVSGGAAAGTRFPPQMPAGLICPLGMWPAVGSQEEMALQQNQRIQRQERGPVRPHFINLSAQLEPRRPKKAATSGTGAHTTKR